MANSVLVRSIAFLCLLSLSLSLHLVLAFVDRPALTVPSSGKRQEVSTKATSSSSSSTAAAAATFTSEESAKSQKNASSSRYIFENYDKPIVLLGLSSSPANDEIRRLALSLSGSLAGNDPRKLKDAKDTLERSQGAGLIDSYHDDDFDDFDDDDIDSIIAQVNKEKEEEVIGIALSALGLDDEGPFVLDGEMIGEFIHDKILTLTTGVIVLDFNHLAFSSYPSEEVDLIRALGSVAKRLYENEKLLCIYVNINPDNINDATASMSNIVKEWKRTIENEILIPFTDYELCIRNEGSLVVKKDGNEQQQSSTLSSSSSWSDVEWELRRIIARALLPPPVVGESNTANCADLVMGKNTFFLSLSFPNIEDSSPYVEKLCEDVDSMEYRVDLLQAANDYSSKKNNGDDGSGDPRFDILYQQQRLRALCRPHARRAPALPFTKLTVIDDALPIVYTVRTAHQAGTWPDNDNGIKQMFDLLDLGLRSAVEVLDVESAWDEQQTTSLLQRAKKRYTSLILGSHHVVGTQVNMDEAIRLYRQCRMNDRAHGAKVVLSITSNDNDDDQLAYKAAIAASKLDKSEIPNIGLVLGEIGSYSRMLNQRFTPVTHEALPVKAAPGQLTAAEIMAGRFITGMIPSQRYAILGHNIAYSVSPQMHGSAFAAVKLPHTFSRADVETVTEFVEGPIWNDDDFGGCSVTVPHKVNIIPHVDVLTDAAKEIGSVNTVIVKKDKMGNRVLIGDNTDWRGIYNPLKRRMDDQAGGDSKTTCYALILGGGGTARAAAYAASKLGLERIFFNRTPEKAMNLATEFGGTVVSTLDRSDDSTSLGALLIKNNGNIKVVMSTLPAAVGFELPEWLLEGELPLPIVFDVNYKPYNTPLLLQSSSKGCQIVRGSEMLWEQGVRQFELWMGRTAPYGVMKRVVLENCLPNNDEEENK